MISSALTTPSGKWCRKFFSIWIFHYQISIDARSKICGDAYSDPPVVNSKWFILCSHTAGLVVGFFHTPFGRWKCCLDFFGCGAANYAANSLSWFRVSVGIQVICSWHSNICNKIPEQKKQERKTPRIKSRNSSGYLKHFPEQKTIEPQKPLWNLDANITAEVSHLALVTAQLPKVFLG